MSQETQRNLQNEMANQQAHIDHGHRKIFNSCLRAWWDCCKLQAGGKSRPTKESPTLYSRKTEEYMADFEITCRRGLTHVQHALFAWLLGQGPKVADERAVEALEAILGAKIEALKPTPGKGAPYALYPPKDYFGRPIRTSSGMPKLVPLTKQTFSMNRRGGITSMAVRG